MIPFAKIKITPEAVIALFAAVTLCTQSMTAQEIGERESYMAAVYLTPSFSYGGLNTEMGVHVKKRSHLIGAGYRLIASESRFFARAEHGFALRYTRYLLSTDRWAMGLHARTFQTFGQGGARQGEYLIGQQLDYLLSDRLTVGLTMGAGMYEERLVDERYGLEINDSGATGMVGIEVHYMLSK